MAVRRPTRGTITIAVAGSSHIASRGRHETHQEPGGRGRLRRHAGDRSGRYLYRRRGTIRDFTDTRSTIYVGGNYIAADIDIFIDGLAHSFPTDVQLYLERGAQSIRLIENDGPGRDGAFATTIGFDDQAAMSIRNYQSGTSGPYRPVDALNVFNGQGVGGAWTLRAYDSAGGDNGSFGGWRLVIDDGADVPPLGAVPEPATWAMMIAGFGLVGQGLRRRGAVPVPA